MAKYKWRDRKKSVLLSIGSDVGYGSSSTAIRRFTTTDINTDSMIDIHGDIMRLSEGSYSVSWTSDPLTVEPGEVYAIGPATFQSGITPRVDVPVTQTLQEAYDNSNNLRGMTADMVVIDEFSYEEGL